MTNDYPPASQFSSWVPPAAYREGGDAYARKETLADNPHPVGSPECGDWEHGYCDAEGYGEWSSGSWDQGH